jgi:hypothetical protein
VRRLLMSLVAWEFVVLSSLASVMLTFGKTLNAENERKLAMTAVLGLFIALVSWPVCRVLPRIAGWVVGALIGLVAPPLCAWTWAWAFAFPSWTGPFEIKLLGLMLALPSALGGMIVGGLQSRTAGRPLQPTS